MPLKNIVKRGSKPPVALFLAIRQHGAEILRLSQKGTFSERSLALTVGLNTHLFRRSKPFIEQFEQEIAAGNFENLERALFEPVSPAYRQMPFYKKLMGLSDVPPVKTPVKKIPKGQGRAPASPAPISPPAAPPATLQPVHSNPVAGVAADPFFDDLAKNNALLTRVHAAVAAHGGTST
jgi:hypothetical protein